MAAGELGTPVDLHGGAVDLQFPHHENEIAQTCAACDSPFVNVWMHNGFVRVDDEKMSKSLGNFFTTREVLDKLDRVQGGEQVRYFFLRAHYRSEVSYSWDTLMDAGQSLRGLYTALREVPPADVKVDWEEGHAKRFRDAMNDDFDTPIAFAVLHELRGEVNRAKSRELAGLLKALGGTIAADSKDITITAPDIAENGAVVPVAVASAIPKTESIAILIEKNPNTLAASFDIPPGTDPAISTRVKMGQSSNVYALVKADGKYYVASKEIKVTLGGCGG